MPCQQYLDLVQATVQRMGAEVPEPLSAECDAVLRKMGVDPEKWCYAVAHFGDLFHRAVGHVEKIVEIAQRVGRKWLQGSRACADVFT
jgi:hypothetical protein